MDSLHATLPQSDDLSALAWVHEELRKSLDAAHKALHRCLKEAGATGFSDMDAHDPAVLRTARLQIHQGVGALELAGLPAGALLLRASETIVQKFVNRPQSITEDAIRDIERASFALLDYIGRRLAGKPVPAMALFPQYEALMTRIGGDLPRPTDLWSQDWPSLSLEQPLAPPEGVAPRPADVATVDDFETGLLMLLRRNQPADALVLADLCASLATEAAQRHAHRESATWMLASGFLEALAGTHVPLDVHAKRVLSSMLSQLRVLVKGKAIPSDRLANELLFFCAQAGDIPASDQSVLSRVRRTFGLGRHKPVDLGVSTLGRYDPALVTQAVKRVAGAKDGWSAVAAGELLRLGGLSEQFSLVHDSLRRLYPDGQALADALSHAAQLTVQSAQAPEPSLAMEVATSLLYLEASLEDGDFDHPDQQARVRRLAERIESVSQGHAAQPLESWMEDLYRRVSDRQTIGSVVQELRTTLSECEKQIDQFFRDPQERAPLVNVPSQLQSMRGVLAVLGLDLAAQASMRMRDDVDHLLLPDSDVQQSALDGVFDRLASNLGALGFLIDMLGVQPGLAKTLFTLDPNTGVLSPLMGREKSAHPVPDDAVEAAVQHVQQVQRDEAQAVAEDVVETLQREDAPLSEVSEQLQKLADTPHVQEQAGLADSFAAAQAALDSAQASDDAESEAAAREQVALVLNDFTQSVSDPVGLEEQEAPQPLLVPTPVVPAEPTGLEEDDEMRGIFLEEAQEVLEGSQAAVAHLAHLPGDVGSLTALRRGFHTLKGSSRMVGLSEYGEAAWACEQLYNTWLASQDPASPDLLAVTRDLLDHFAAWTEAISAHQDATWRSEPVVAVADAFRLHGRRELLGQSDETAVATVLTETADDSTPLDVLANAAPDTVIDPTALPPDTASSPLEAFEEHELIVLDLEPPAAEPSRSEPSSNLPIGEPVADQFASVMVSELPADLVSEAFGDLTVSAPSAVALEAQPSAEIEGMPAIELDLPDSDVVSESTSLEAVSEQPPLVEAPADQPWPSQALELDPEPAPQSAAEEPGLDLALRDLPADNAEADAVQPDALSDAEATDDQVKIVGPLRISIPLFNIYLNEADEQSRRLCTTLSEWSLELHRPVADESISLAHSLAGNSATVGYAELSQLARLLEHALMRSQALGPGEADAVALFNEAAEEIRRLLHQFAAGFLKTPADELMRRLEWYDHEASRRLEARSLVGDLDEQAIEDEAVVVVAADPFGDPLGHGDLPVMPGAPDLLLGDEPPAFVDTSTRAHLRLVHSADEAHKLADSANSALPEGPDFSDSGTTMPAPLGVAEFKPLEPLAGPGEGLLGGSAPSGVPFMSGRLEMGWADDSDIDAQDNVDPDLFPIFEEEALELLPQLSAQTRQWLQAPREIAAAAGCMRTLHTFKGGARLAGAMRLGEMAHRMESSIERLLGAEQLERADVEPLESRVDHLVEVFDALRQQDAQTYDQQASKPLPAAEPVAHAGLTLDVAGAAPAEAHQVDQAASLAALTEHELDLDLTAAPSQQAVTPDDGAPSQAEPFIPEGTVDAHAGPVAAPALPVPKVIDWSVLSQSWRPAQRPDHEASQTVSQAAVRVRPQLLDRLVNHAGEVSITRTRLASQVGQIRGSLTDLTDNLDRLRHQLRDIEFQAETQLSTRIEAARAARQDFDPLEFDSYTRFQELTRMMAESVNDVATVQRSLQRTLETAEDQLAAQARLTRDLQDDLLRTRMVEFEGLSDRLYRVVRQAAKETGKQVRLDIVGGSIEVDRGVLERMTGSFEHLLRNCITHGIETPAERTAAGKDPTGLVIVALRQEGNEVAIEFRDDGVGLNLERIREKAVAMGLVDANAVPVEAELSQLIFTPGFSTAEVVTELAGRGIGMDVVRSEVNAMGGRIETATTAGQGTSFTLILPLTTAVTKVVMLRCGQVSVAVPTHLIEMVRRAKPQEVEQAYHLGSYGFADLVLPFYWLGSLLDFSSRGLEGGRSVPVVVIRSAQQRIALHVDEVLGNQEVVVKNLGPQLSRMPGLAGMTLLASGAVSLIYNPVALATVYGDRAHAMTAKALANEGGTWLSPSSKPAAASVASSEPKAPLIMVVDDSLTVRRVTQRLLAREGYRVILAKDGLEALELVVNERPAMVLSDIEMPRMDGFDLVRNLRGDPRLADLPIIMITSRIAQKHREYATELGVNHYLGKPYGEEELLALVARHASSQALAAH